MIIRFGSSVSRRQLMRLARYGQSFYARSGRLLCNPQRLHRAVKKVRAGALRSSRPPKPLRSGGIPGADAVLLPICQRRTGEAAKTSRVGNVSTLSHAPCKHSTMHHSICNLQPSTPLLPQRPDRPGRERIRHERCGKHRGKAVVNLNLPADPRRCRPAERPEDTHETDCDPALS